MAVPQPFRLFAPCVPGLEPLLLNEVRAIGGVRPKVVPGGVELEANQHVVQRCLLELGLAMDVRVRLGTFHAPVFDLLVRRVAELPWGDFIGAGQSVEIRASAKRSRLMHTGAIEQRVREGIKAVVGSLASEADDDAWRVFARMENDRATISLSLAGDAITRRGYKKAVGKAPLREDLAHALLVLSGWSPEQPLVDPFCGSGTIAIEAARRACGIPPGWDRDFHFHRSPTFDRERWDRIRAKLAEGIRSAPAAIHASDRDEGVIGMAKENAERAGVTDAIRFEACPLGKATFPAGEEGWWISNPPYGARVKGGDQLRNLYQSIGQRFRSLGAGWRLGLLTDDPKWAGSTGVELESAVMLDHGGHKVRFYIGG